MKVKTKEYQVKFSVRAVAGVSIRSATPEAAIEKARKVSLFADKVDYIDGNITLIGWDNLDGWKVTEEKP